MVLLEEEALQTLEGTFIGSCCLITAVQGQSPAVDGASAASGFSTEWEGSKPLALSALLRSGNPASCKLVLSGTRFGRT